MERYLDVTVETVDKEDRGLTLRGLLDSGCSKTIVLKKFTTNLDRNSKAVKYQTYGGQMTSTATSNVEMKLIGFSSSKTIKFPCQVDRKTYSKEALYDIILGSDFMEALGVDIWYSKHCITWDGETIPLKPAGTLDNEAVRKALYFAHTQSPLLQEVEAQHQQILDADYSKVDLVAMVDELEISPGSRRK